MKLISCHIENFGRLRDFDYRFAGGLNTIFHENGWGKSTFAAFLCAMLYGMPPARKKNASENERLRYRPWQGGVYGGSLLFEAAGRSYEISRVFGTRESEDVFELRDIATNLPSFAFSEKTGEELFHLDRGSFRRTVFTAQQDCVTSATDDVNALVAALEEQAGDLAEYGAAMKRLAEAANRLSPGRQSGVLYRRAAQIDHLEREVSQGGDLQERVRAREESMRGAKEEEAVLCETIQKLEEQIGRVRREEAGERRASEAAEAAAAARGMQEHLRRQMQIRQKEVVEAAGRFPGRVPTCAEADRYLELCRQMERLEDRMEDGQLSAEEQKRLTELEEMFPEAAFGSAEPRSERTGAACGIAGILLVPAGVLFWNLHDPRIGIGITAAGVMMILLAGVVLFRKFRNRAPDEDALLREYTYLWKKEQRLEIAHARWAEIRRPVERFLREVEGDRPGGSPGRPRQRSTGARDSAFSEGGKQKPRTFPEEDLYARLSAVRDAADHYEDAQKLLREVQTQLHDLEQAQLHDLEQTQLRDLGQTRLHDLEQTQLYDLEQTQLQDLEQAHSLQFDGRSIPSELEGQSGEIRGAEAGGTSNARADLLRRMLALQEEKEEAQAQLSDCRGKIAENGRILEELLAQQEEQEEDLRQLHLLRARQEADAARYRQITMASKMLQKAKEAMAARYSDPIRERFSYYWEKITGSCAAGLYVDADSHVTVEEAGRQRDASLLSEGYKDLTGICLRAALADAMYPAGRSERPPLILDDPFVNLDDENMEGALRFLEELSAEYQILYFTCSCSRTL